MISNAVKERILIQNFNFVVFFVKDTFRYKIFLILNEAKFSILPTLNAAMILSFDYSENADWIGK